MTEEFVILVDKNDRELGVMEKLEAHQRGVLHRAISILIFNSKGEMLLQKRAESKYHSGGLWTNACCSHPRPGESVTDAAARRLKEEMGIETALKTAGSFMYQVELGNGLTENEYDHILIGTYDGLVAINTNEVASWKFVDMESIRTEIEKSPYVFTHWFKLIMNHWHQFTA